MEVSLPLNAVAKCRVLPRNAGRHSTVVFGYCICDSFALKLIEWAQAFRGRRPKVAWKTTTGQERDSSLNK